MIDLFNLHDDHEDHDASEPYLVAEDLPDDSFQSSVAVEEGDITDKEPAHVDAEMVKQDDIHDTQDTNSGTQANIVDDESIFNWQSNPVGVGERTVQKLLRFYMDTIFSVHPTIVILKVG